MLNRKWNGIGWINKATVVHTLFAGLLHSVDLVTVETDVEVRF